MKYVHTVGSRGTPESDLGKQKKLIQLVEANYKLGFGGEDLDVFDEGNLHLSFFGDSGFQIEPYGDCFIKKVEFRPIEGLHRARVFRASPNGISFYLDGREVFINYGDASRIVRDMGVLSGSFHVNVAQPRLTNLPYLVSAAPDFLSLLTDEVPYNISFRK